MHVVGVGRAASSDELHQLVAYRTTALQVVAGETEFNEKTLRTACSRLEALEWQTQMAGTYAARLQDTLAAVLAIRSATAQSAAGVLDQALALPLPGAASPRTSQTLSCRRGRHRCPRLHGCCSPVALGVRSAASRRRGGPVAALSAVGCTRFGRPHTAAL